MFLPEGSRGRERKASEFYQTRRGTDFDTNSTVPDEWAGAGCAGLGRESIPADDRERGAEKAEQTQDEAVSDVDLLHHGSPHSY